MENRAQILLRNLSNILQKNVISGLLVVIPLYITYFVIHLMIRLADKTLQFIPAPYQYDPLLQIPGLSLVLVMIALFIIGLFFRLYAGKWCLTLYEGVVKRIPIISSVHSGAKKVLMTLLTGDSRSFRKVLLVEYPKKDLWSLALLTNEDFRAHEDIGEDQLVVFIPTTPNPTSGFLLMVDKQHVREVDLPVEQAFQFIISLGVINPHQPQPKE